MPSSDFARERGAPQSGLAPFAEQRVQGSSLLDVLPTAVLVVNAVGHLELVNQRALEVLGSSSAALGAPIERVLAPFEVIRRAADSDDEELHLRLELPHSREVVLGYRVRRLQEEPEGAPLYLVVLRDVTQWERLREERDRLMRLAAVSEVLPAVLHELKNPLAAIGVALELLVEDCEDGGFRERLHAVLPEIRRMSLTLEGIGSVGRELPSARFSAVDYALRESFMVLERQARERGIAFVCEVADMPLLPFDVAMIRAIAFNLLTNAVHACARGDGVWLRAALVPGPEPWLRIEVEDTGSGMEPEVLARCCELFFTTKARGSGIGLALCDRAVRAAGGNLRVESQLFQGTKVTLQVPAQARARTPEWRPPQTRTTPCRE